jgi:hypothetical protein
LDEYLGGGGIIPYGMSDGTPVYHAHMPSPAGSPSVFVSLEPYAARSYDSIISTTGFKADAWGAFSAGLLNANVADFTNHVYFNTVYGDREFVVAERVSETAVQENQNFEPGHSAIICYRGATGTYNKLKDDFSLFMDPAGFFPLHVFGPGFKDMVKGGNTRPRYEHERLIKTK